MKSFVIFLSLVPEFIGLETPTAQVNAVKAFYCSPGYKGSRENTELSKRKVVIVIAIGSIGKAISIMA